MENLAAGLDNLFALSADAKMSAWGASQVAERNAQCCFVKVPLEI